MPSDVFALHQSGLIYETHFNVNLEAWDNSEVSGFIGAGQTRLWDKGRENRPSTTAKDSTVSAEWSRTVSIPLWMGSRV